MRQCIDQKVENKDYNGLIDDVYLTDEDKKLWVSLGFPYRIKLKDGRVFAVARSDKFKIFSLSESY